MGYIITISEVTKNDHNELGDVISIQDITPSPTEYEKFTIHEVDKTRDEILAEQALVMPEIKQQVDLTKVVQTEKVLGEGKYENIIETPVPRKPTLLWKDGENWKELVDQTTPNYDGIKFKHTYDRSINNSKIIETEVIAE